MPVEIIEKAQLSSLVSPQRNQYVPIHNWFAFKHGYSRDFAINLITSFNVSAGSWILDPFCGGGTTLLTCKEVGINSRGFDILPFSVFLSNVKIEDYDERELLKQLEVLKRDTKTYHEAVLPDIPIIKKAFQHDVEKELLSLKTKIDKISDPQIRAFFNLGFLSILESVSNTSKTGGFLRIVNRGASPQSIQSMFLKKVTAMVNDVTEYNKRERFVSVSSLAKIGDARKLSTNRKYDCVLTSPPYPNRHDYTRIYSLEMVFDFISNNDELKKIRYETIRSHVEARKKYEARGYEKPATLNSLITAVKKNGTNNPQVVGMLEGYFEDMYLSLSEIHRCLRSGGKVGMVISNVRFAGVNIPVDEILSDIGSQVGLTPKAIWIVRYRGNSSQQMRDYDRSPSRESVVIWEKHDS